jgi:ABC-type multidrug transport system ATPase subunit
VLYCTRKSQDNLRIVIHFATLPGKSSLMNVLAGRTAKSLHNTLSGLVTVDGIPINPVKFRQHIAYVMQDDALVSTLTPREAICFSAVMRIPSSVPMEKVRVIFGNHLVYFGHRLFDLF